MALAARSPACASGVRSLIDQYAEDGLFPGRGGSHARWPAESGHSLYDLRTPGESTNSKPNKRAHPRQRPASAVALILRLGGAGCHDHEQSVADRCSSIQCPSPHLPGIDDGRETLEDAVAMAKIAAESGTTDIVATPHANARFTFDPELIDHQNR